MLSRWYEERLEVRVVSVPGTEYGYNNNMEDGSGFKNEAWGLTKVDF
jgi:hypothetical protein